MCRESKRINKLAAGFELQSALCQRVVWTRYTLPTLSGTYIVIVFIPKDLS
jgi:hypothetical protein